LKDIATIHYARSSLLHAEWRTLKPSSGAVWDSTFSARWTIVFYGISIREWEVYLC